MIIVAPAVTQLSENATDTDFNIKRHSWNRSDQPLLCLCLLAVDLSNNLIHIHALSLILWWLMIAGEEQTSWRRKSDYNLWSQEIIITNEQAASCQKYPKSFSDLSRLVLVHTLYIVFVMFATNFALYSKSTTSEPQAQFRYSEWREHLLEDRSSKKASAHMRFGFVCFGFGWLPWSKIL